MSQTLQSFIDRWRGATGSERGNLQTYLLEFCEALELPKPGHTKEGSDYCFEAPVPTVNREGVATTGHMDLWKQGCFILEGKQTSEKVRSGGRPKQTGHKPLFDLGEATTPYSAPAAYDAALNRAFGQALDYAKTRSLLGDRAPFLIVCDVGAGFHVWDAFRGGFGRYASRRVITLDDLHKKDIRDFFKAMWTNPHSLDPEARSARATREIAKKLGELAKEIRTTQAGAEGRKQASRFLMRCVFTFFAEDIGLLPKDLFLEGLRRWESQTQGFQEGLARLWATMNEGGAFGHDVLLRFNGGLFKDTEVLPLSQQQIALLKQAAQMDWREIEPSIFGNLLETALEDGERASLGAHYTPRAHIQRLVDATFANDLWARWTALHDDVLAALPAQPDEAALAALKARLHGFRDELGALRVLDPACGSGNFLYVAYDTLKRMEFEVLATLQELGETRLAQSLEGEAITPAHFLGLEVNEWAAGIAELVLWIAHLQWFKRVYPATQPSEPVLHNYGSIDLRDAVLTGTETRDTGRTRWGGRRILHRLTGQLIPDPSDQVPIFEYLDPQPAAWPEADFILGNPPFLGNAQLREALGDGTAEALRIAYPDVPDTVDLVMYWWHKAALQVREGRAQRFGLITTNSLRQVRQRGVIAHHCGPMAPDEKPGGLPWLKLLWAIPDHPWGGEDAAVRIAMTVGGRAGQSWLGHVVQEGQGDTPEAMADAVVIAGAFVERIHPDLSAGAEVTEAISLKASAGLCSPGMKLHGAGFLVSPRQWEDWGRPEVVHPYRNGKDLVTTPRGLMVIDLYGLAETDVRKRFPQVYQHVLEHVKPERDQNNDITTKKNWWIFGRNREDLRPALAGLPRYIATVETAKHRVFQFLDGRTVPDNKLIVVASDDAYHLGVLSSRVHGAWALAAGSFLGVGNDPVYVKSRCFDPFPFPEASEAQRAIIRELADQLDAHRKEAQSRGATLAQMYNLLETLRAGGSLSEAQRKLHEKALTSLLLDLHQRLDEAVLGAYGWPAPLGDEGILERLVALNRERAGEEAQGRVRWLRPEYQGAR